MFVSDSKSSTTFLNNNFEEKKTDAIQSSESFESSSVDSSPGALRSLQAEEVIIRVTRLSYDEKEQEKIKQEQEALEEYLKSFEKSTILSSIKRYQILEGEIFFKIEDLKKNYYKNEKVSSLLDKFTTQMIYFFNIMRFCKDSDIYPTIGQSFNRILNEWHQLKECIKSKPELLNFLNTFFLRIEYGAKNPGHICEIYLDDKALPTVPFTETVKLVELHKIFFSQLKSYLFFYNDSHMPDIIELLKLFKKIKVNNEELKNLQKAIVKTYTDWVAKMESSKEEVTKMAIVNYSFIEKSLNLKLTNNYTKDIQEFSVALNYLNDNLKSIREKLIDLLNVCNALKATIKSLFFIWIEKAKVTSLSKSYVSILENLFLKHKSLEETSNQLSIECIISFCSLFASLESFCSQKKLQCFYLSISSIALESSIENFANNLYVSFRKIDVLKLFLLKFFSLKRLEGLEELSGEVFLLLEKAIVAFNDKNNNLVECLFNKILSKLNKINDSIPSIFSSDEGFELRTLIGALIHLSVFPNFLMSFLLQKGTCKKIEASSGLIDQALSIEYNLISGIDFAFFTEARKSFVQFSHHLVFGIWLSFINEVLSWQEPCPSKLLFVRIKHAAQRIEKFHYFRDEIKIFNTFKCLIDQDFDESINKDSDMRSVVVSLETAILVIKDSFSLFSELILSTFKILLSENLKKEVVKKSIAVAMPPNLVRPFFKYRSDLNVVKRQASLKLGKLTGVFSESTITNLALLQTKCFGNLNLYFQIMDEISFNQPASLTLGQAWLMLSCSTLSMEQLQKIYLSFLECKTSKGTHQLFAADQKIHPKKWVRSYHHVDYLAEQITQIDPTIQFEVEEELHLKSVSNLTSRIRNPIKQKGEIFTHLKAIHNQSYKNDLQKMQSFIEITKFYQQSMRIIQKMLGCIFPKFRTVESFFSIGPFSFVSDSQINQTYSSRFFNALSDFENEEEILFAKELCFLLHILDEYVNQKNWMQCPLSSAMIMNYIPAVLLDLTVQFFKSSIIARKDKGFEFNTCDEHNAEDFPELIEKFFSEVSELKFLLKKESILLFSTLQSVIKSKGRYPYMETGELAKDILEVAEFVECLFAIDANQVSEEMRWKLLKRFMMEPSDCEFEIKCLINSLLEKIKARAEQYVTLTLEIVKCIPLVQKHV